MSEPRRWLDDPDGLSPDERRVLEAGLDARAPTLAKNAVKSAVLARLPAPDLGHLSENLDAAGAAGASAAVPTAASATLAALAKSTAIGFALGVATTSTWVAFGPSEDVGQRNRSNVVSATAPTAAAPAPGVIDSAAESGMGEAAPSGRTAIGPTPSGPEPAATFPQGIEAVPPDARTETAPLQAPSVRAFPEVDSTLDAASTESRRLAEARALLRSNDPRGALGVLDGVRREHPRGVLVQEREVLTIEALLATGDEAAAKARAREFVARYPRSPHAASARRVLERP